MYLRGYGGFKNAAVSFQRRHKIFGGRQHENIGILRVVVERKAFVGLSGDRCQTHRPPQAKGAVAGVRVIRQRELRTEASAPGRSCQRHREGAVAHDWVRGEFLADASNGTATGGQANGWGSRRW